jgi:hypothetical protein
MKLMRLALIAATALAAGCRHDPVEQEIIDGLGPDTEPNDEMHRKGQPCLACHDTHGGARPFAVAGTVFKMDPSCDKIIPAPGVLVTIVDSSPKQRPPLSTNGAGNFYVDVNDVEWNDLEYPLSPMLSFPIDPTGTQTLQMQSLVGRDRSCATCHQLPVRGSSDTLDKVTGAGRHSAGVILAGGGCP